MRNISFALTTEQIRNQTKTVTRRVGWASLKPGTLLQPVVKGQGIPKGGTVEKIGGPIRVVSVRRERLDAMIPAASDCRVGDSECVAEGFPLMWPQEFVTMFCDHNGCQIWDEVTRIEFVFCDEATSPATRATVAGR